jgi:hypothetical protein
MTSFRIVAEKWPKGRNKYDRPYGNRRRCATFGYLLAWTSAMSEPLHPQQTGPTLDFETEKEEEPSRRLGKKLVPYRGPAHHTRKDRTRMALIGLAVVIVVYAAILFRVVLVK